jgi:hypothetical protein
MVRMHTELWPENTKGRCLLGDIHIKVRTILKQILKVCKSEGWINLAQDRDQGPGFKQSGNF